MRVLHVVDRFGWSVGGGDLYVERILEPLERMSIESAVAYFNCNPARSWPRLKTYYAVVVRCCMSIVEVVCRGEGHVIQDVLGG